MPLIARPCTSARRALRAHGHLAARIQSNQINRRPLMKSILTVVTVAFGLVAAGTIANAGPTGPDPTSLTEHHSTQHNIGPCGTTPCPSKPTTAPGG